MTTHGPIDKAAILRQPPIDSLLHSGATELPLDSYTENLLAEAFAPDEFGRISPLKVCYSTHEGREMPPTRNLTDADSVRRAVRMAEANYRHVAVSYDTCG